MTSEVIKIHTDAHVHTYAGIKVQLIGKGGHNLPLEEGVPGGALIEVATVDKDRVWILGPEVLDSL